MYNSVIQKKGFGYITELTNIFVDLLKLHGTEFKGNQIWKEYTN